MRLGEARREVVGLEDERLLEVAVKETNFEVVEIQVMPATLG